MHVVANKPSLKKMKSVIEFKNFHIPYMYIYMCVISIYLSAYKILYSTKEGEIWQIGNFKNLV